MTQPLPSSSSRKRSHSETSPTDGAISLKKKRKQLKPDGDEADNSAGASRDKKKRKKKKKRRLSVTALADGRPAVDEQSEPTSTENTVPDVASDSRVDRASQRQRDGLHARSARQALGSFKGNTKIKSDVAKGKERAIFSKSPPPSLDPEQGYLEPAGEASSSNGAVSSSAAIIARLGRELEEKKKLLALHTNTINSITNSLTCQICVDLMHRPFLLTPCGHLACYTCLLRWFTEPSDTDNMLQPPPINIDDPGLNTAANGTGNGAQAPAPLTEQLADLIESYRTRRPQKPKTCPHCRARIRSRPVEVYGVKSMAGILSSSGLVTGFSAPPATNPPLTQGNNPNAGASSSRSGRTVQDPWADQLPGSSIDSEREDRPGDEQTVEETLETHGFHDREDGVYRCVACMHEIWDGVCSNDACGREYSGHTRRHPLFPWMRNEEDDDDEESDEDEEEERIFDDMLRAQFPLEEEEEEDNDAPGGIQLYADFTSDEDGPDDDVDGPVRVNGQQYRAGFRVGRGQGYHEGYEEGFEEGLEEGRYQAESSRRNRGVVANEEEEEEEEEESYEGSFIDDEAEENSDAESNEDPLDTDDAESPIFVASSRGTNNRVYSESEREESDEEDNDVDDPPVVLPISRRRNPHMVLSDSD
ncbi:hypothetical protein ONZ45_g1804 [Pleurotus djamor]|nr:hypothetical protein ONZ45_g1804 [Pleurotus djamor]